MASCPLYKRLREKGTTFISFPSAANDVNSSSQDNLQVTKFVLLNIPRSDGIDKSSGGKVLNFTKTNVIDPEYGINTYNFDPNSGYPTNNQYADQLVESIRNYIANQDACFRETRLTMNSDFYNPLEKRTPTEEIFWKWCRLHNIIDLEPAEHKIDWDKNLSDFDNPNASTIVNNDYFRKYLWKEREIRYYTCTITSESDNPIITIDSLAKFKVGDDIWLSGATINPVLTGSTHTISNIEFGTNDTTITLNYSYSDGNSYTGTCYLHYHKLIQYIGEIQATSQVKSSQQTFTEFTAMIPSHAGMTPTILFEINQNTNYYPGLEIPILDEQIQDEIIGSEILSSPIRTNPTDYPGSYFGYYDTFDKTYVLSPGDSMRYSGEYYGNLKLNNVGLAVDDAFENLTDFNSDNIDGLCLDFNLNHYYRAQQASSKVNNFDEFNTISINGNPPSDFEFNAILWYYNIHDYTTNKDYVNLYGIEFLDNPDNDYGTANDRQISLTKKLVTNSTQDGYSYIYNLNLNYAVDNDMLPLRYDPTSIYDIFGFDLYNKVMSNYVLLTDQFKVIIGEFMTMNEDINKLKSLLYSQTDINDIKNRLRNMEDLLKMYQTNQFVNSDTVKINIDYTKNYPALSFNVINVDYNEIYNLYTTDIVDYNMARTNNTGTTLSSTSSQIISVPNDGKFLVNIYNNMVIDNSDTILNVALDKDLQYKQSVDFIIRPDIGLYYNVLNINLMFYDGTPNVRTEKNLIDSLYTPIDISEYDPTNPTGSTFNTAYYMNLTTFVTQFNTGYTRGSTTTTGTSITINDGNLFYVDDWIFIEDFLLMTGTGYTDYSGMYKIVSKQGAQLGLNWDTYGMDLIKAGTPKVHYYKGIKVNILRIDESDTSDIDHRYLITKEFLTSQIQSIQSIAHD